MSEFIIKVPDLGDDSQVTVVEIIAQVGDTLNTDDPVVMLEGDKASMEVPATAAGTVKTLLCKVGDKVGSHSPLVALAGEATESQSDTASSKPLEVSEAPTVKASPAAPKPAPTVVQPSATLPAADTPDHSYASPSVRRLARELGIQLNDVAGTGRKNRITREDLNAHIKGRMTSGGHGMAIPAAPSIDFSQFGDIETVPMNKIKRLTGEQVHRSWVTVPHVTQFDEADITDMEAFRQAHKKEAADQGIKLTPIVFVMKALVSALKAFPHFNASLTAAADAIVMKSYWHIGVAVDTPNGLVVPVIRDVDRKSLYELSEELVHFSQKARKGTLTPADMKGGCMTISSLGGIGGTAFTPIVNVPEVAILGLSKATMQPVYQNGNFEPRLILPLSLSYDHRVIDGADGARFTQHLAKALGDIRTLLL